MLLGTIWLYDNNFETFDTFVERLTKRPDARFVEIPDFRGDPIPCFNTSKRFVCTKYMKFFIKVYAYVLFVFHYLKLLKLSLAQISSAITQWNLCTINTEKS